MKKNLKLCRMSMILVVVSLMTLVMWVPIKAFAHKQQVYFFTELPSNEIREKIEAYYQTVADGIATVEGYDNISLDFGEMLRVYGNNQVYYIPVFVDSNCVYVIKATVNGDEVGLNYGVSITNILNELENGFYYFEEKEDVIYLVGDRTTYVLENFAHKIESKPIFDNSKALNTGISLCQKSKSIKVSLSSKSVLYKELTNLPYIQNYGNGNGGGCCWLSSAYSVCKYYGTNAYMADEHHAVPGHGNHSVLYCPGGTLSDSLTVLNNCIHKTASNTTNNQTPSLAYSQIYNDLPVITSWTSTSGSGSIGHAMVICGYIFDNGSSAFTYIIMDPDVSTRVYIPTTYNTSGLMYGSYSWVGSLYNICDMP